jgi:hypothetical protein
MVGLRTTTATFSRSAGYKFTFIALGLADLFLTLYAVSAGYVERNPVFESLLDNPAGLFLLKVAVPTAIAWLVPARLLAPSIGLLLAVLGWNIAQLAQG